MRILVVGAGMYVTGREGTGAGTIISALAEYSRSASVDEVVVVARSAANAAHVQEAATRVNGLLGTGLNVRYEQLDPEGGLAAHLSSGRGYAAAVVSVPDHAHFEVSRELLVRDIPALVVKPLTPTLAEAKALCAIARERRCYGAVEFHKRFDETNLYARKVIASGTLGKLLYFTVDYSQRISIPEVVFRQWANRTNIFQYLAVHYVDLIHFLTGFTPLRASAVGTRGTLVDRGITEFDSVHATIIWKSPADGAEIVSQFSSNWIDPNSSSALSDQKYKIVGTEGRLELDQKDRGLELVTGKGGIQHANPYFSEFLPDQDSTMTFGGYGYKSIDRFLRDLKALRAGRVTFDDLQQTRPSFASALPSVAVIEAVNRSLVNASSWEPVDGSI